MGMVPQRQTAPRSIPKMTRIVPLYPPSSETFMPLASVIPQAIRERFDQQYGKKNG